MKRMFNSHECVLSSCSGCPFHLEIKQSSPAKLSASLHRLKSQDVLKWRPDLRRVVRRLAPINMPLIAPKMRQPGEFNVAVKHSHLDTAGRRGSGGCPSVCSAWIAAMAGDARPGKGFAGEVSLCGIGVDSCGLVQVMISRVVFHRPHVHPYSVGKDWSGAGISNLAVF